MGRRVKCRICGQYGTNETFYKVTDDRGRNKYYCSQEEYENFINEKEKRYELLKYVAEEILEYEEGQIVPPVMVKRIEKLNEFYDYEVIHETFHRNKETIHYWRSVKNFSSEYGMVAYIMTIIEGNINDVYYEWKRKKEQTIKIENNEIDIDILNDIEDVATTQTTSNNGILEFLDEGDI